MVWLAAALVFAVIFLRFPRKTLFITACLCLLGIIVGGVGLAVSGLSDWQRTKKREAIALTIEANESRCPPSRPIFVTLVNKSGDTTTRVSIHAESRRPGYSKLIWSGYFESDKILKDGESLLGCFGDADWKDGFMVTPEYPASTLSWSGKIWSADFED